MNADPTVPTCPTMQHIYSEESARHKLARHRLRGEFDWAIVYCTEGEQGEHAHVLRQGQR